MTIALIVIFTLMIIGHVRSKKAEKAKLVKCKTCIDGVCQCNKVEEEQGCGPSCGCKH